MLSDSWLRPNGRVLEKPDLQKRRSLGIYYTPPQAAQVLARWAIRRPTDTVLEPSFGGCAMLSAAVGVFESMAAANPSMQLFGFDVDPDAFEHLSRLGLSNSERHFRRQDFLRSAPNGLQVDAVLANPPFVSHHRQSEQQRKLAEQLRQRYLPGLPRLASLWVHFVLHSMSYLKTGGRMAFVLPNAINSADYARPLMRHLQSRFTTVQLLPVSERLFIQAGTDERISLLLLDDYKPEGISNPSGVRTFDVQGLEELQQLMKCSNPAHDGATPLREAAAAALDSLHESCQQLGELATVRIGEVVGNVSFFVKAQSAWRAHGIDDADLAVLATRASQLPGLDSSSSKAGDLLPYLLVPRHPLKEPVKRYLELYPLEERHSNRTFQKRTRWYECSYQTDAHAFIGSMNHAYPRIILNTANISVSNAFYKIALTSHAAYKRWLPLLSLTTPMRLSAEVHGRVRGSGGIKLEPSDVRRLLVPRNLPPMNATDFARLRAKVEALLSSASLDAANQLLDSEIFIKPGLIDASKMSGLRTQRMSLTHFRLRTLT